jgi:phage terminase small subunit
MENQSKHLTKAEKAARTEAERDTMPQREAVTLTMPGFLKGDERGKKYWEDILKRMEGVELLDDLDTEVLGVYCAMLSRRDATGKLLSVLHKEIRDQMKNGANAEALAALADKLDKLTGKLQGQERTILQYADKLGLTPAGRVSLARKRAAKAAEDTPEGDLFGD